MEIAALVAWIVTALGGFVLLGIWLRQRASAGAGASRIGPGVITSHFLLAAVGLVLWIVVVATDAAALPWVALALLVVVAVLGFVMVTRWWSDRSRAQDGASAPPEQHFPVAAVVGHGLLGAVTLVLVLLVAAGVG